MAPWVLGQPDGELAFAHFDLAIVLKALTSKLMTEAVEPYYKTQKVGA